MLTTIIKAILNSFAVIISFILNLLPNSPFNFENINIPNWVVWVNYFIPISEMLMSLEVYLTSIIIFYSYRIILRWIKMIG